MQPDIGGGGRICAEVWFTPGFPPPLEQLQMRGDGGHGRHAYALVGPPRGTHSVGRPDGPPPVCRPHPGHVPQWAAHGVHFLSVYFFSVYTRSTPVDTGKAHRDLSIFGGGDANPFPFQAQGKNHHDHPLAPWWPPTPLWHPSQAPQHVVRPRLWVGGGHANQAGTASTHPPLDMPPGLPPRCVRPYYREYT